MLSFVLFTFFIILYFVHPQKSHCMLAKREKLKEKMYENQKVKKNVEGIPNICLSCLL